ncbi:hypothetical protein [Spiroplasma tabanidicola]|uniref:Transmembrane protein n=1 Tax=Spiroplasma tabanidicola TaxID=324079 RepID=A0A6I6C8E2_9MOLU|nr:hypothetical protein [Spiroplasma tabanidicola]QGS51709.1 hypothetical protein STABA_v1c03460 [Spiroplasma tabanidicola]
MSIIVYVATALTLVCLITLKMFNIYIYSSIKVVNINSADINISTSKINDITTKLVSYLNVTDLKIIYGETDFYCRITKMLNRKKQLVEIPKWIMPSVGYELDYLIASIWYNSKLYKKDKYIKRYNFVAQILPSTFILIYIVALILDLILIILNKYILSDFDYYGSFFEFLGKFFILDFIAILFFFMYITCLFFATKHKINIEATYEREIVKFVDENCEGYKSDIGAARVYSLKIDKLYLNTFLFNKKTSNIKFCGPFTML